MIQQVRSGARDANGGLIGPRLERRPLRWRDVTRVSRKRAPKGNPAQPSASDSHLQPCRTARPSKWRVSGRLRAAPPPCSREQAPSPPRAAQRGAGITASMHAAACRVPTARGARRQALAPPPAAAAAAAMTPILPPLTFPSPHPSQTRSSSSGPTCWARRPGRRSRRSTAAARPTRTASSATCATQPCCARWAGGGEPLVDARGSAVCPCHGRREEAGRALAAHPPGLS